MRARVLEIVLVLALVAMTGVPAAAAQPQLDILDSPEVVVANDPETMSDDPETEQREFNPEYVFSASIRVTNDGSQRDVQAEAIVYADQDVEDSCPQDRQAFPVAFVFKRLNLSASERVQVGGETSREDAQGDEYWPMALSRTYRNAQTGQNVSIEEGPHTFCAALRATGEDPACDRSSNRTCVIATAPFESYVRRQNEAPWITSVSVSPENPRPDQRALLSAEAQDNSTEPREDTLSYTWHFDREEQGGASVQHTFGSEGVHEVTLEVTDGFDTVERTIEVPVGDVEVDGDDGTNDSPAPGWAASLVALALVAGARRRSSA